jgi:hypothetical protein
MASTSDEPPTILGAQLKRSVRLMDLADTLANRKLAVLEAADILKIRQEEHDAAEAELFDALEATGVRQIRTPRGLFSLNDLAWARIADPEKARAWAETYLPEVITLNLQRVSKIVRDALKGEVDVEGAGPDGLPPGVTYSTSRKVTWRRQ